MEFQQWIDVFAKVLGAGSGLVLVGMLVIRSHPRDGWRFIGWGDNQLIDPKMGKAARWAVMAFAIGLAMIAGRAWH
ncbi:MAG TPA: hypothetical protein VGP72_19715 [Planctomycetota bacterium]|jgi:hypothetical protein